jgi:adenine-specific DNA-methyltransferase
MRELKYIAEISPAHRKKLGQYFTPEIIAKLMMSWVTKDNPAEILDPAFGLGAFYDALNNKDIRYIGYEIDENIVSYVNQDLNDKVEIHIQDYLESNNRQYDAIVCNPPYLRFQNFKNRHTILPKLKEELGISFNGYSNIASIFLAKSLSELNIKGRLAYIMPFEFFNTGYGTEIKKVLTQEGLLKQIIIFENEKEIFPEVITTVCILLCKNDNSVDNIKITKIGSKEQLYEISDFSDVYDHELSVSMLPYTEKWSNIITLHYCDIDIPDGMVAINSYGKFMRGIATGANEYFAMSLQAAKQRGIKENYLLPCITKSPQIKGLVFTDDVLDELIENGVPVYCFSGSETGDDKVKQYIEYGESMGYHKRYLTKKRKPWYKLENRQPAPILSGVFNRGKVKFVRNFTNVINFTCFHSFYPNMFGQKYINRLFVYFISRIGQEIIKTNKRKYGNGLDKFEPGDLNSCLCPSMEQFNLFDEEHAMAIIEMAKTDENKALIMADEVIEKILSPNKALHLTAIPLALHSGR